MKNITNSQIREYILNSDHENEKVTIKQDGQILVRTRRGGDAPWTMFWGNREDAVSQIAREQEIAELNRAANS